MLNVSFDVGNLEKKEEHPRLDALREEDNRGK
jgi:hypothetical protein